MKKIFAVLMAVVVLGGTLVLAPNSAEAARSIGSPAMFLEPFLEPLKLVGPRRDTILCSDTILAIEYCSTLGNYIGWDPYDWSGQHYLTAGNAGFDTFIHIDINFGGCDDSVFIFYYVAINASEGTGYEYISIYEHDWAGYNEIKNIYAPFDRYGVGPIVTNYPNAYNMSCNLHPVDHIKGVGGLP